ncbi:TetR/AcrR family transcriptional regulator [Neobacillus sp. Marseille-QA0830]
MNTSKGMELFSKQPAEKQEMIIQAALAEFAEYGFDLASTNRIVENAHISKGVLFKYFSTKEQLFIYLMQQKMEKKLYWMNRYNRSLPSDFFEILRWSTLREMEFFKEEPLFFKTFQHVSNQHEHPVYQKVLQLSHQYSEAIVKELISKLPVDDLRHGISVHQAFQFISWVFEGFKKQYMVDIDSPDWENKALDQVDQLFELIKYGIYEKQ